MYYFRGIKGISGKSASCLVYCCTSGIREELDMTPTAACFEMLHAISENMILIVLSL